MWSERCCIGDKLVSLGMMRPHMPQQSHQRDSSSPFSHLLAESSDKHEVFDYVTGVVSSAVPYCELRESLAQVLSLSIHVPDMA